MISAKQVQELRQKTGVGIIDCKEALTHSGGNEELAIEYLRKKGIGQREKRADKKAADGLIYSYVHTGNKVGVMIEVNCETDFVARSEEFKTFVKDLSMHIAASKPRYVSRSEVDEVSIHKEREVILAQMGSTNKPQAIIDKIVSGKLDKFYQDVCLMEQYFVKNPDFTIEQLLSELVSKVKENVVIKRFMVWQLGETNT